MIVDVLEWVGLIAFAASGALVGVSKRLDLFGVCAMGIVTGVGGGVIRDVLLGINPPTALTSLPVLFTVLTTACLVFALHPTVRRLRREVLILDALGMGFFASTGTVVALDHDAPGLTACLVGATTAIGGGVLRDVMVNQVPLLLRRDLYAVPALMGAGLVAGINGWHAHPTINVVIGTVAATGLRLVSLWRRWSLPMPPRPD